MDGERLIYISSTFQDLIDYRKAAMSAIRDLKNLGIGYNAMEDYQAESRAPLSKCLEDVDLCDIYLGIFAWRYGNIDRNNNRSITELEYRRAREKGKTILVFLSHEDITWPAKFIDLGTGGNRIRELRSELEENYLVDYFSNPDHLRLRISLALLKNIPGDDETTLRNKLEGLRGIQDSRIIMKDLLDIVFHELRTPATIQAGYTHLLCNNFIELDDSSKRQSIEALALSSQRIEEILGHLGDLIYLIRAGEPL